MLVQQPGRTVGQPNDIGREQLGGIGGSDVSMRAHGCKLGTVAPCASWIIRCYNHSSALRLTPSPTPFWLSAVRRLAPFGVLRCSALGAVRRLAPFGVWRC